MSLIKEPRRSEVGMPRSKRDAKAHQDAALDEALDDTFPASDPIAVGTPTGTEPPRAPVDRKAPLRRPETVSGQPAPSRAARNG